MAGGGGVDVGTVATAPVATTRTDVTLKLPQLQNLCKRDPVSYREDYEAQVRRLESELTVLQLQPQSSNATASTNNATTTGYSSQSTMASDRVVELIQFAAAVSSSSYKGAESDRIATLFMILLGGTKRVSMPNKNISKNNSTSSSGVDADANINNNTTTMATVVSLHKDVRRAAVSALILMRNKGTVPPLDLLQLFFSVMTTVPDKALRDLLYRHMVNDIRNINKKGKRDDKVNRSVQSFLHRILQQHNNSNNINNNSFRDAVQEADASAAETACKRAVDMVCELYRRRVWTDDRTVAILASAVEHVSNSYSVSARAMRFFLGIEEKMALDERTQRETEWNEKSGVVDLHLHSKKTCRRARQTERALKNKKRAQHKKETLSEWMDETPENDKGVETSKKLYPAMELLRDPHGLAETIFKRLKGGGSIKYETKLLMINFVTRLAGNHELLILPLYTFLQKYMGGHQRDVTAILAYTVQACHSLVPPDEIFGILKTISHNFITERCSEEQMAVGINAVRAICARVPTCMAKEDASSSAAAGLLMDDSTAATAAITMDMEAFARDLAAYATHRDRSVGIAGKAWLNFVREVHPALLSSKDRGLKGSGLVKFYGGQTQPVRYGEHVAAAGVDGADLLVEYEARKRAAQLKSKNNGSDENSNDDDEKDEDDDENDEIMDSGSWEEVDGDDADNADDNDSEGWEDVEEEENETDDAPTLIPLDSDGKPLVGETHESTDVENIPNVAKMTKAQRDTLKQQVSSTRIFSASDFAKMKKLVERENRAKFDPREAARRKRAIARGQEFEALSESESDDDSENGDNVNIKGTVNPEDIMAMATRKRQSKADKLEKVLSGRSQFETKKREGGSTNIEKKRKKNFIMSKFSQEARSKGRGKNHSQKKRTNQLTKGTHEARKRRRKV